MLFSTTTPEAKRIALREMLAGPRTVRFPGAYTPLSTRLIQEQGFDGVYISGAVLANELGFPDIGLTALPEVAARAGFDVVVREVDDMAKAAAKNRLTASLAKAVRAGKTSEAEREATLARLRFTTDLGEFADRQLHPPQQREDPQPGRVRQSTEDFERHRHAKTYKEFFI